MARKKKTSRSTHRGTNWTDLGLDDFAGPIFEKWIDVITSGLMTEDDGKASGRRLKLGSDPVAYGYDLQGHEYIPLFQSDCFYDVTEVRIYGPSTEALEIAAARMGCVIEKVHANTQFRKDMTAYCYLPSV